MQRRWFLPLLLAVAAPSGFGGSAAGSFGIDVQLLAAGGAAPVLPAPAGQAPQDSRPGPATCSSASGASSIRVSCSTPTFVQISDGQTVASSFRGLRPNEDACGQLASVPGLTCVSYAGHEVEQTSLEGVSLLPASTALRLEEPGAAASALYEIRRRDSLSTLVAVQTVDPESGTVELLITF